MRCASRILGVNPGVDFFVLVFVFSVAVADRLLAAMVRVGSGRGFVGPSGGELYTQGQLGGPRPGWDQVRVASARGGTRVPSTIR